MATYNKKLETLTVKDVENISLRYLKGWHDFVNYGFRLKGFNCIRNKYGMVALNKSMSDSYRVDYIRKNFSYGIIFNEIATYLSENLVANTRSVGIEILGCRFGREYARLFKELLGSSTYRKLSNKKRIDKLVATHVNKYGGVGLAGDTTRTKAIATVKKRYGVDNVMHSKQVIDNFVSPFSDVQVRRKAHITRLMNKKSSMTQSSAEAFVYESLISKYGVDDVLYEYGIHPYDARYPYSCDFYIKSQDLFIEVNSHYSHGNHWYDSNNHDDNLRVKHLIDSGSKRSINAVKTWTKDDVSKRLKAKKSGIKYLVFWDGTQFQHNGKKFVNVSDFKIWFYDYDCDYYSFIKDHPENTY